ncbi:GIY-YIG nuclease family protein [Jeongeupia sp. HS-3]|uniref:GIY-YIG nuclease family protein n=1 Tax=Jeongeupia sp. HS-3 TaxID=1009682 RepID=UPI001910227E|nr:GIY-YIG nuclease family protein [Jeongeupia sp. HS-3]
METETLRKSVGACALTARDWFFERAIEKTPNDWSRHNSLQDQGIGAIYAFFGDTGQCLYVGQTTQTLKERANLRTSCHYEAPWWDHWTLLRFVNTENQTDQLVIEMLLILALSSEYNSKPAARNIHEMLPA